ncbi:MAG: hypothetical protein JXR29_10160 [Methylothermaceae bacterium]|nr:hypothetical protein [Methylothermaceae bacterium]
MHHGLFYGAIVGKPSFPVGLYKKGYLDVPARVRRASGFPVGPFPGRKNAFHYLGGVALGGGVGITVLAHLSDKCPHYRFVSAGLPGAPSFYRFGKFL